MPSNNSIVISPEAESLKPAADFVVSHAKTHGMKSEQVDELYRWFSSTMSIVMAHNIEQRFSEGVEIQLDTSTPNHYRLKINNRGLPIFQSDGNFIGSLNGMASLDYKNEGSKGQVIKIDIPLIRESLERVASRRLNLPETITEYTIRPLKKGEEHKLSQLFYLVYGYNYIHDDVYYPEKLREMIDSYQLIPFVAALPDGRLLGHVGVVKLNDNPDVWEIALGVVDPNIKSKGTFTKLFARAMEAVQALRRSYCVYEMVTNHDFSQRMVSRYGSCDLAIFIGNQISETQAKLSKLGVGSDSKDMDRYSILLAINPGQPRPFGKEIVLPSHLGGIAEFILKPLGIEWVPATRFSLLPEFGDYTVAKQEVQKTVIFDLAQPGRKALQKIVSDWQHYMRQGYDYAAIEFPINCPGLGQLYDLISRQGFFISGFVPYRNSNQLGLRFQALTPKNIAFDDLKLYSATAQKILQLIRTDYERNRLL